MLPEPASRHLDPGVSHSDTRVLVALDAALAAYARGVTPIPLHHHAEVRSDRPQAKVPIESGWQHTEYASREDVHRAFGGTFVGNIGVLLGEPSNGLLDVDLDHPLAVQLAPRFLPPTPARFGRASKPLSHWLYYATGVVPTTERKKDHKGATIVEVRGTGGHTVIPPSIHESGERIEWAGDPWGGRDGPARVDASDLVVSAGLLSLTTLLAEAWPDEGGRHDAYLALAGALLRDKGPDGPVSTFWEDWARIVFEALVEATNDTDPLSDRMATLTSTARNLRAGVANITGWPTLGELLGVRGKDVVTKALRLVQDVHRAAGIPFSAGAFAAVDGESSSDARPSRRLVLTPASKMKPRPTHWLWDERIARGTFALIAGEPSRGKSTFAYWLAARVTRGELPGVYEGVPKAVLVAATEESWEQTILPRLIAAGADLDLVYRVEAVTAEVWDEAGVTVGLHLRTDMLALELGMRSVDAALLLLDPLTSRLGERIDTHKDAEVRLALEPLVAMLDRVRASGIGLMHFNKGESKSAMKLLMGSVAFGAVARSVHVVERDPEDPGVRLVATVKNNLGREDTDGLPLVRFTVASALVPTDEGEDAEVGVAVWKGEDESGGDYADVMRQVRARERADEQRETGVRTAASEAREFLERWLRAHNFSGRSSVIKADAADAEVSSSSLAAARRFLGVRVSKRAAFGGETSWVWLPEDVERWERRQRHSQGSDARGDS